MKAGDPQRLAPTPWRSGTGHVKFNNVLLLCFTVFCIGEVFFLAVLFVFLGRCYTCIKCACPGAPAADSRCFRQLCKSALFGTKRSGPNMEGQSVLAPPPRSAAQRRRHRRELIQAGKSAGRAIMRILSPSPISRSTFLRHRATWTSTCAASPAPSCLASSPRHSPSAASEPPGRAYSTLPAAEVPGKAPQGHDGQDECVSRQDVANAIHEVSVMLGAEAARRIKEVRDEFDQVIAQKDAELAELRNATRASILPEPSASSPSPLMASRSSLCAEVGATVLRPRDADEWLQRDFQAIRHRCPSSGAPLVPPSAHFLWMRHAKVLWEGFDKRLQAEYAKAADLLQDQYHRDIAAFRERRIL